MSFLSFARRMSCNGKTSSATLHCTEVLWTVLRDHLLKPDRNERVAFAQVGRAQWGTRIEYFLHGFKPVADGDCAQQHAVVVEPEPLVVLDTFGAYARSAAAGLMHLHSHPFCDHASFSGVDDANLPKTACDLASYLRTSRSPQPKRFLRFVTGWAEDGFTIEVMDENGIITEQVNEVRIIGRSGLRTVRRWTQNAVSGTAALNEEDRTRLDRNLNWLGEAGQQRIAETHVAIVGLGGLGSEIAKICRGLGFQRYTLIDHDRVELSNLNRLPWSRADVGRLKVDVAREFITAAMPCAQIITVSEPIASEAAQTALAQADVIIGCLDNDHARLQMQDVAARHLRPLLDMGSGITLKPGTREVAGMGGQVSFHIPGSPCLACQGLDASQVLDPEHTEVRRSMGYVQGTAETPTSVVTINSIVAALGGDTLMKWLTGFSKFPSWLRYDLLEHKAISMMFMARKDCPICGSAGILGIGTNHTAPLPPPIKASHELFSPFRASPSLQVDSEHRSSNLLP